MTMIYKKIIDNMVKLPKRMDFIIQFYIIINKTLKLGIIFV